MAPPGSLHAATVHYLAEILVLSAAGRASVLVQNPVRLSEYSELQPDLALLRLRDDLYAEADPWRQR